tara:strand:- start:2584 stop:4449 length:1866 start_codon:yes stop_codon:yes gene_type:complete
MKYRSEIDGLRALAVLPVIFFHAGIDFFKGGYIGVDIFFVISGYLITSIILREINQGKFSILNFYERRARRILPALFFVMSFSLICSWFFLLPGEFKNFGQSLISVTFFVSNIFFWRKSGYFDGASEYMPLLHTWSLSVEEQFYLLFPIFLVITFRFGKRTIVSMILLIAFLSLGIAEWGWRNEPQANFYLTPTRVWELMIGALASFYLQRERASKEWHSSIALIGFLMIVIPMFYIFDGNTPFPSYLTLFPTVGTVMIIVFASENNLIGRLFSLGPLVKTGLISYSMYLWHVPLFVFSKYLIPQGDHNAIFPAIIFLTFFLAYMSWRYIEQPFRQKENFNRKQIFSITISSMMFFFLIGIFIHTNDGYSSRFSPEQQEILAYQGYEIDELYREEKCFLKRDQDFLNYAKYCATISETEPNYLIWGDSHAASLYFGLKDSLKGNLMQLTSTECNPFSSDYKPRTPNCLSINEGVKDLLLLNPNIEVFIYANWYRYSKNENFQENVASTIGFLTKNKISFKIIGGTPQFEPSLPHLLIRDPNYKSSSIIKNTTVDKIAKVNELLNNSTPDSRFIDSQKIFCIQQDCQFQDDRNNLYFWDYGHLTKEGSLFLASKIGQIHSNQ